MAERGLDSGAPVSNPRVHSVHRRSREVGPVSFAIGWAVLVMASSALGPPATEESDMLNEIWRGDALVDAYGLWSDGGAVYWVRRRGLEEPSEIYLLVPGGTPTLVTRDDSVISGVGFDDRFAYYAALDRVLRVPKVPGARAEVLCQGEPQASDLIVVGEELIWTNPWFEDGTPRARGPLAGTVRGMAKSGGRARTILASGEYLRLLGHDEAELFLVADSDVVAVPRGGGAPRILLRDKRHSVFAGLVHGDRIYVTAGGELRTFGKHCGAMTVLARGDILLGLAVLGSHVFVARNDSYAGGKVVERGGLLRVPLSGGGAVELGGLSFVPARLAAGPSELYVLDAPLPGREGVPRLLVARWPCRGDGLPRQLAPCLAGPHML